LGLKEAQKTPETLAAEIKDLKTSQAKRNAITEKQNQLDVITMRTKK